uniref:S1-like domain-containing protein n=1 Tax=Glossina palpalis gambiensis TaxID=67801 RepID=A0A1B0BET2_9MUSC
MKQEQKSEKERLEINFALGSKQNDELIIAISTNEQTSRTPRAKDRMRNVKIEHQELHELYVRVKETLRINLPELEEFLKNAVETSTQCINRKLAVQEMEKGPDTSSLKNNSPISIATLSDSTCCNGRTNSINKVTPKERMDRLSIYGEAPPINLSPVLMVLYHLHSLGGDVRTDLSIILLRSSIIHLIEMLRFIFCRHVYSYGDQSAKYDKIKEMIQDTKDGQQIVRIIASRVVTSPTKFRKHVWIKRGDFILVEPIECFKRDDNIPNGRCTSNYVKESCDEDVEEFEEKFSGPCHLSPNRNLPSVLATFEDEKDSSHNINTIPLENAESNNDTEERQSATAKEVKPVQWVADLLKQHGFGNTRVPSVMISTSSHVTSSSMEDHGTKEGHPRSQQLVGNSVQSTKIKSRKIVDLNAETKGAKLISFDELCAEFHRLVAGNVNKWYWQVLVDHESDCLTSPI